MTRLASIDPAVSKHEAIAGLSSALGMEGINPWSGDYAALFAAARVAGLPRNAAFVFCRWDDVPGAVWHAGAAVGARLLPAADRLGTRRMAGDVEYPGQWERAPPLDCLELPDATVLALDGVPVIVAADGVSVIETVSSNYAPLLHLYDLDAADRVAEARRIAGVAFVLMGDIADGNYCHWLIDELPRLALLRDRADATIVMTEIAAPWRRELLGLLGVPAARVVELGRHEALRADTLLIPDVARNAQHPARRGAAWVVDWLRGRIGLPTVACRPPEPTRLKLYIGRGDADRRRLLNERDLLAVLEPAGFTPLLPGRHTVAEQVTLFARAEAVVALHGAALANLVFCPRGTPVVEVFTPWHGTHAFGLLSAAAGLPYASYVAEPGRMPRDDRQDCRLDVPGFWRAAGPWLTAATRR